MSTRLDGTSSLGTWWGRLSIKSPSDCSRLIQILLRRSRSYTLFLSESLSKPFHFLDYMSSFRDSNVTFLTLASIYLLLPSTFPYNFNATSERTQWRSNWHSRVVITNNNITNNPRDFFRVCFSYDTNVHALNVSDKEFRRFHFRGTRFPV